VRAESSAFTAASWAFKALTASPIASAESFTP
jgi:hypothetical protein